MRRVISVAAAGLVAAAVMLCFALKRAGAAAADDAAFLFFGGTDLWRYGAFINGGLLWSPDGINNDGFTLKTLLNGGVYTYNSGTLHETVHATTESAAILPGWRYAHDNVFVSVYAGAVVQDFQLRPYDPGGRLHGLHFGGELAADVWYQPTAATMVSVGGAVTSIGPTGWLRGAFGVRLFDAFYAGPENQDIWCGTFEEVQLGGHVTALRIGALEWSAGTGWALTSDHRHGPYLRLGVNARY